MTSESFERKKKEKRSCGNDEEANKYMARTVKYFSFQHTKRIPAVRFDRTTSGL
jgi:hypothetical protein